MTDGELIIVGVGPRGLGQLTLESLEALKSCRLVLAAAHGPELEHLCRGLKVACRPVAWSGEAKRAGTTDTKGLAARVRAELRRGGRVAVAVDGNPALFSVADALMSLGPAKTYAAVSSLDQALVALRARLGDMACVGVRALNLAVLPASAPLGDPTALTLLFNLGGSVRRSPATLAALSRRLGREIGSDARAWLVECAAGRDAVKETCPKALAADAREFGVNVTLAVPPSRRRR